MYARLNSVYWTEIDPLTGDAGPFVLKDVFRKCGMINGVSRSGMHTGRPVFEFDAVSIDGENWLPLKENISLIPQEPDNVRQPEQNVVLGL